MTRCDPKAVTGLSFLEGPDGKLYQQKIYNSRHSYPIEYYSNSISSPLSGPDGFPLSFEGGGWTPAFGYPVGLSTIACAEPGSVEPLSNKLPSTYQRSLGFVSDTDIRSSGGNALISDLKLLLGGFLGGPRPNLASVRKQTDVTANLGWASIGLTVTNDVNLVRVSVGFEPNTGTNGVVSVFWNTNRLGMVEQAFAASGITEYVFGLDRTYTDGLHSVGFRLDGPAGSLSQVTITNLSLGFRGVSGSSQLSLFRTNLTSIPLLSLTGPTGYVHTVESSTNLADWRVRAYVINSNQSNVTFVAPITTNAPQEFFRSSIRE